ncbi:MAG: APC family permease, partial [Gammaproteobacteria bacterium]|nr:APC family permease [Gammaproteobacteria bacterium]
FVTTTHGKDTGFIFAIANWLGIVAVIPTEAVASVQYLANLSPESMHLFYNIQSQTLSLVGLCAAFGLLIVYLLINFWGVGFFAKVNNTIGIFKILIPVITAVAILLAAFHSSNFTAYQDKVMPYGISSVFIAIVSTGIIYAFNGFQVPLSFSAEAKDPAKNIPRAIITSLVISLVIYLALQAAFIGALPTSSIAAGWHHLNFHSPLVQLTIALGLNVVTLMLYADSVVSPSGTGLTYTGTTSRMLCAMAQEKQAPAFFAHLHPKYHLSRRALFFNVMLAGALLFIFRSWTALVTVLSVFHIVSYMSGPLATGYLRKYRPDLPRAFKMFAASILNPLLFVVLSMLVVFARYPTTMHFALLTTALYMGYIYLSSYSAAGKHDWPQLFARLKDSCQIAIYMWTLAIFDMLSPAVYGGNGVLASWEFYSLVAVVALIFYYIMLAKKPHAHLPTEIHSVQ